MNGQDSFDDLHGPARGKLTVVGRIAFAAAVAAMIIGVGTTVLPSFSGGIDPDGGAASQDVDAGAAVWPDTGLAQKIPVPAIGSRSLGTCDEVAYTGDGFTAFWSTASETEVRDYIAEVRKAGFSKEYKSTGTEPGENHEAEICGIEDGSWYYAAYDSAGDMVMISYFPVDWRASASVSMFGCDELDASN